MIWGFIIVFAVQLKPILGKTYLRAIAKKKIDFKKQSKRKLELQTALLNGDIGNKDNGLDIGIPVNDSEYSKYGYLAKVSTMDVKSYFLSIINHMLKKQNSSAKLQSPRVNVNFDPSLRRHSKSLSSRKKPPPPKRSSRQLSVSKGRAMSGTSPPPPPPRRDSKSVKKGDDLDANSPIID